MKTKTITGCMLGLIAILVCVPMVYAQEGTSTTLDLIFGFSPVVAALGITVIGVTLRTVIGMVGKPKSEFNPQLIMVSLIVGFFASLQLVVSSLQHIPVDISELGMLSIITGEIATVMGIDAAVKSGGKRVQAKFEKIKVSRAPIVHVPAPETVPTPGTVPAPTTIPGGTQ